MGRKSYLGGHTLLTQSPGAYLKQMERDAVTHRKRAARTQQHYDKYKNDPNYRREFDKKAFALLARQKKKSKPRS